MKGRPTSKRVLYALIRIEFGETPYRVAKEEGIALSTLYRAVARLRRARGAQVLDLPLATIYSALTNVRGRGEADGN